MKKKIFDLTSISGENRSKKIINWENIMYIYKTSLCVHMVHALFDWVIQDKLSWQLLWTDNIFTQVIQGKKLSEFVKTTFNCVYKIVSLYQSDWNDVVSFICRDLHNISELDNSNSASAECIGNVLQSQLLLTQVRFYKTYTY